jgi:hypothetical protein
MLPLAINTCACGTPYTADTFGWITVSHATLQTESQQPCTCVRCADHVTGLSWEPYTCCTHTGTSVQGLFKITEPTCPDLQFALCT